MNDLAERLKLQRDAGLPNIPTALTYELRLAVSGEGPRAYDWSDKPHRVLYDACRELERIATLEAQAPDEKAVERVAAAIILADQAAIETETEPPSPEWGEWLAKAAIAAIQDHPTTQDPLNKAEAERDRAREELAQVTALGDALLPHLTHSVGCALYQASYAMTFPDCSCGKDQALAAWNAR